MPPENANSNLTDEDSGEEDNIDPSNLPASQLRAPAELALRFSDLHLRSESKNNVSVETSLPASHENSYTEDGFDDSDDNIPLSHFLPKSRVKKKKSYHWVTGDIQSAPADWPVEEIEMQTEVSPSALFDMIFDDDILNLIVTESNRYAAEKNRVGNITKKELKAFLGIMILSGYIALPRRRMYWEQSPDTHNDIVSQALARNRFEFILSNLHFVDNNRINTVDKFAKVRPLFDHLNKRFLEMSPLQEQHSVDESMVPYFGRHGCKQYIHGKPIRYGYKLWMGCSRLGYVNWFEPYQGAATHVSNKYKEHGVGAGVVLTYADTLRQKWPQHNFHFFFDNFFSSLPLFSMLKEKNIRGTGTLRKNRLPANPFTDEASLKKSARGTYVSKKMIDDSFIAVQWNDNNIVTIGSNAVGVAPMHFVKRYSYKDKKTIHIEQPHIVNQYNQHMGGVDRCDENISLYRTSVRGKKWYFPLISNCIDLAVQNAWQLHKLVYNGKLDHLAFRRQVALALLQANKKDNNNRSTGRPSVNENMGIRYDNIGHFVIPQVSQTRCRLCHAKTTTRCVKCDVGLHVKCFIMYHTPLV